MTARTSSQISGRTTDTPKSADEKNSALANRVINVFDFERN
jgi:hypothetical protein